MASGIGIDRILVLDCETSGINWESAHSHCNPNVALGYQSVAWGMVITDPAHYKPIDELYVEIKWNGKSKWDMSAEKVHKLSKEHLEEHGLSEEDALYDIIEFIMKHIDIKKPIYCMGHNVMAFDIPFFRDLLCRHNIKGLKFGHRHFDSFALSMGTVQELDSESLFNRLGLPERKTHNALEDTKYTLEVYRRIHRAWTKMLANS